MTVRELIGVLNCLKDKDTDVVAVSEHGECIPIEYVHIKADYDDNKVYLTEQDFISE